VDKESLTEMSTGTAVAPNDALFKEFQSYVQAIYEDATNGHVKSLKDGLDQAVDELQGGVKSALQDVDGRSSDLRDAIASARQDFYGLFNPIFSDYRAKIQDDQQKFVDQIMATHKETYQTHRVLLDAAVEKGFDDNQTTLKDLATSVRRSISELEAQSKAVSAQVTESGQLLQKGLEGMAANISVAMSKSDSLVKESAIRSEELCKSTIVSAYSKVEMDLRRVQSLALGSMIAAAGAVILCVIVLVRG